MLAAGCLSRPAVRTESPTPQALFGSYFGAPSKIYLCLQDQGIYTAGLGDCMGTQGVAEGTWQVLEGRVRFNPKTETKQIRDVLRSADLVKDGEHWALVPPECRKAFDHHGLSDEACLRFAAPLLK
jgi:hypothetical protein